MKSYVETIEFKVGELVDVAPFVNRVSPNCGIGMIIEILPDMDTYERPDNIDKYEHPYYKVLFGDKIVVLSQYEINKHAL